MESFVQLINALAIRRALSYVIFPLLLAKRKGKYEYESGCRVSE
jgi:hypothetical protein